MTRGCPFWVTRGGGGTTSLGHAAVCKQGYRYRWLGVQWCNYIGQGHQHVRSKHLLGKRIVEKLSMLIAHGEAIEVRGHIMTMLGV